MFAELVTGLSLLIRPPSLVSSVPLTNLYVELMCVIFVCFDENKIIKIKQHFYLQAVTKDGFGCIRCPGSISDDGKCLCPADNVLG